MKIVGKSKTRVAPGGQVALGGRVALGGLTGWVLARLRKAGKGTPRLALLDRITLAPRQSLALVEAEGRRFLVATSAEGGPAFYPLQGGSSIQDGVRSSSRAVSRRVSW